MQNIHVKCLCTNYSCVTLKKYEFKLTLKKAVLKHDGKAKIVLKIYRNLDKEMDESRTEVEIHQEKVDFINDAYKKGLRY